MISDNSDLRFLKAFLSLCGNLSARLNPNSKAPSLHVPHGKLIFIFFIILRTRTTLVEFPIVVILILGVLRWHLRSSRIFLVYIGRFILSQLLTENYLNAVEPHLPNAQISRGFFLVLALMLILLREMGSTPKNMWLTHKYWPWVFRLTFSATNADDLDESSENERIIDADMEVRRSNSDTSVKTPNDPRMWRRRLRVLRWV